MKRLEVNPKNEKYYTKDFISGYRCGTKRQLDSDLAVIEKIREEIGTYYADCSLSISENDEQCKRCTDTVFCSVLQIIDKHIVESEDKHISGKEQE